MIKMPKKAMVIGLDAPIAQRVYDYAKQGKLPTIARLIENGVYAIDCLVPFPTITPPNWTTIVTGAWPGTHGITDFTVHRPGDPFDQLHQGFDSADCQAEYIWDAAARVGKKSIIINWPSTWPPTLEEGYQLGGVGLGINEWRNIYRGDVRLGLLYLCDLCDDQVFSTEVHPLATEIELQEARGWQNMPPAKRSLEAELPLVYRRARFPLEPKTWHLLVLDTTGDGYDRILLSETKDAAAAFADLGVGEWSQRIVAEFASHDGPKKAAFRCRLVRLSPEATELCLYVTGLCALEGWSYPESLAAEISSEEGLPMTRGVGLLDPEWIGKQTFLDSFAFQHAWLADAACYLLAHKQWDLFFLHAHTPDWMYHIFGHRFDPLTASNEQEAADYQGLELAVYQNLDALIGRITALAGEETLVIIVSDHGAKATTASFAPVKALAEAGLTIFKDVPAGQEEVDWLDIPAGQREIDWSKSRAVVQRSCYVYVNLKGRDPQGIVERGEEYEQVRDQIIEALYSYVEPTTGRRPIVLALRREDARIMGLYGERTGDVVYAVSPHFGAQHGPHLPTAEFGVGSLKGLFIMSGPGVKRNYLMGRTMWLTDIVPTICHLLDLPIPREAEGAILYQALVDPEAKSKELAEVKRNYAKLKGFFEKEQALTHTYNL
ncbi:MAG: alkaline phosphatase family protein [Chloroflexi bacterium]|nr:alkaline phosphatase family protein [Chloroflexota bacterium]MCL5075973.1 alkaline phosphatase family protein [Chloroflexota bacterium]